MKKILVIYYSQSGDVASSISSLVGPLEKSAVELTWEKIVPKTEYSYPWNLYKFFDVFPECINEEPPEIEVPKFDPQEKFDLIILAYQIWFLAPSLPIQGFMKSPYAKVMQDTKVITLIGCRNMWHSGSEAMKRMIAAVGGIHIDNVVVTHQGAPVLTFITTPRMLLTGKRDSALGILPPGGFRVEEIEQLAKFGHKIAASLDLLDVPGNQSLLCDLNPVEVNEKYIIPESIGRLLYGFWAKLCRSFGQQGDWTRIPIICLFALILVFAIPLVLFFSTIVRILFKPWVKPRLETYTQILKST